MPSTRDIKRRMQSVKNTKQITEAMKMVSAAKLYKSQKMMLAAKPFFEYLNVLLNKLGGAAQGDDVPPLLQRSELKNKVVVLITGSRGFAGGFNHALINEALSQVSENVAFVCIGSKGYEMLSSAGCKILKYFDKLGDTEDLADAKKIAQFLIDGYVAGNFEQVEIIYQKYYSAGTQVPGRVKLLPLCDEAIAKDENFKVQDEYIFEGEMQGILQSLCEKYVYTTIMQVLMESKTGEHIARMVAMTSATDNAAEMLKSLQIDYNRSRQAAVTKEIAEISGCANAMAKA